MRSIMQATSATRIYSKNSFPVSSSATVGIISFLMLLIGCIGKQATRTTKVVSQEVMQSIYEEIKTPYKYGVVLKHPDTTKLIDSPTIFRADNQWFMTYIVFDGQGYETYLAQSNNLLNWKTKGKILSYTQSTWDANQKAGYVSLVDIDWGGSYQVNSYQDKFWLSYLGGEKAGYQAGRLAVGIANTGVLTSANKWNRLQNPVLAPTDTSARW